MHVRNTLISLLCLCTSASFTVGAAADTRDHHSKSASAPVSSKHHSQLFERRAASLQQWMEQAYAANPGELQKSTRVSPREMADWVFHGPFNWKFDAIQSLQGSEALQLSVSDEFPGDRILAFTTGTYTLLTPYFQSIHQDEISQHKTINQSLLEIKTTLDALKQNERNTSPNVTLSTADYEAFISILHEIEADAHSVQR